MNIETKANYLRIGLGLQKLVVDNEIAERIIVTYEQILKKEGKFSLHDAVEIEMSLDRKFAKKKLEEKE